jgi:hypothetical protein
MSSCPLENKNIYVTSTNRDLTKYPYGNSYTLYLTTPIKDITTVELLYASVPNTVYNVNDGIQVIGFTNEIDTNLTLSNIAPGFYSSCTLSTAVYNATYLASNVTVSFLGGEGKFLFTRSTPFTMNIMTQELASLMGFSYPCSVVATDASTSEFVNDLAFQPPNNYYIKSEYVVEMNPIDGIFLDIQELRTMFNECAPVGSPFSSLNSSNATATNTLSPSWFSTANRSFGMIPMDVSSGFIKRFKKEVDYDLFIDYMYPIQKLDRLTVNWVDKNGNLVHFNGAETNSFILRFHTLRKNLC